MTSLPAGFSKIWSLAMKCEICRKQDALPDCRLCEACGEAIVRLTLIREQMRAQERYEAGGAQQAKESREVASHSLRAG